MLSDPVEAACPLCGRPLVPTERGWRCRMWGPTVGGCKFSLVRHWNHVRLTATDVRWLCRHGVLPVLKGEKRIGWLYVDRGADAGCAWATDRPGTREPRPVGMRRGARKGGFVEQSLLDREGR